jgi:hypothetical protein
MITLQKHIRATLGWYYSLGRKFLDVTPNSTFTVQIANFFAQILLILTFFLPIKILILLASDSAPHYFPLYLKNIKKTHLIVALSFLALACYLFYLVLELITAVYSRKGAQKLLENNGKLILFENQNLLATQVYAKFTRGLSAGTFTLISFLALLYIYKLLFVAATAYALLASLLIIATYNKNPLFRKSLNTHHAVALNMLCSIGFLIIFFCMILDFLYLTPPKIFPALISLLLIRQGLSRLNVFMQDIIALRSQHRQINALFFHNQQLIPQAGTHSEYLKSLLNEEQRNQWIPDALRSVTAVDLPMLSSRWHQLGRNDIYSFEAEFSSDKKNTKKKFLFKLFGNHSTSLAEQERTLLQQVRQLPTLTFLGNVKVGDLACHVFELDGYRKLVHREIGHGVISINKRLLAVIPPEGLTKRFSKSHQYLEQRLSHEILESLRIVATEEQLPGLAVFIEQYQTLIQTLSSLPRQIISQDTTSDTLLINETGSVVVSHWASWKMEPLGSNWPTGERKKLCEAVEDTKAQRPDLSNISSAAVVLCALAYAFERLCQRANYGDAINLLPDILEQLALVRTSSIEQGQIP